MVCVQRIRRAFSLPEITVTLMLLGVLAASSIAVVRPMGEQNQRDEALMSLGHMVRVQDTYFFANGSLVSPLDMTARIPELTWIPATDLGSATSSESATEVSLYAEGTTVLGAVRYGSSGCALVRREYTPSSGVPPVVWALKETAPICSPDLASALSPQAGSGVSSNRPLVLP